MRLSPLPYYTASELVENIIEDSQYRAYNRDNSLHHPHVLLH